MRSHISPNWMCLHSWLKTFLSVRCDNDDIGVCLHETPRHTTWNPLPTNADVFSRHGYQSDHGNRFGWLYYGLEILRSRCSFRRCFVWSVLGILRKRHLAVKRKYPEILPHQHQIRFKEIVFLCCYRKNRFEEVEKFNKIIYYLFLLEKYSTSWILWRSFWRVSLTDSYSGAYEMWRMPP